MAVNALILSPLRVRALPPCREPKGVPAFTRCLQCTCHLVGSTHEHDGIVPGTDEQHRYPDGPDGMRRGAAPSYACSRYRSYIRRYRRHTIISINPSAPLFNPQRCSEQRAPRQRRSDLSATVREASR